MKNVAVVYWSGTGNTQMMAEAVAEGINNKGGKATVLTASEFTPDQVQTYEAIAFGCPSMGAEVLEETEFEPMFEDVLPKLGKLKVALFGSYGWGDGEWMRNWQAQCKEQGVNLVGNGYICNETPGDDELEECRKLGESLL